MDRNKPKKIKLLHRIPVLTTILTSLLIIGGTLIYSYYLVQINRRIFPDSDSGQISITIKRGMSVDEIAQYLKEENLINHPILLRTYLFMNKGKVVQAGFYRINKSGLTLKKLVDVFQKGSFEKKLTFLEGWRVGEYGSYLEEKMGADFAEEFLNSGYVEEGYMFPDTYIIEEDYEPGKLASWMRNNFEKRVNRSLIEQSERKGLNLKEVVTLASIVEREMDSSKDRPIVAGILIKRWKNGWPLQADATVQYALGKKGNWWPQVSRHDLKNVDSPYNTYTHKGLPPTPICNPSLDAIEAVINYEDSPYWFYITGKDGITRYAKTIEEHNANIAKYL